MSEIARIIDNKIPIDLSQNMMDGTTGPGISSSILSWIIPPGSDVPPYWSRARDKYLREFWIDNVALKTAVSTFVNKAVTIPFTIQARDRTIMRHVESAKKFETDLRRNSGTLNTGPMKGFKHAFKQFLIDLVTQDNGGFMQIMGGGPEDGPIVGAPVGILHMDSERCTRTRNPEFPVIYLHTDGALYKLHHTRVIEMTNLPSPDSNLNGVGLCPVSCCLEAAKEIWDIYRYSSEKFGSRPPRQILYAQVGATLKSLQDAIETWQYKLDSDSRSHFGGTLLIAPSVPTQEVKLATLDLNSVPDGFDREEAVMQDKSEIAAAFGMDLLDLALSFGLQGQTRANASIQDRKGRGKGVSEVIETFKERMEEYYLPAHLELNMDYLDDDQDEQRSVIRNTRSQARQRDLLSQVTDIRTERELMVENGEISQEQFEDMELVNGRLPNGLDVLLLFQSEDSDFKRWLSLELDDPTNIKTNDPEEAIQIIHEQRLYISSDIHETSNPATLREARQAIAALDRLQEMYEQEIMEIQMEEQQEQEQENNSSTSSSDTQENNPDEQTPATPQSRSDMRNAARHRTTMGEKAGPGVKITPRGSDKPLPALPEDFVKYVNSIATEFDEAAPTIAGILQAEDG